MGLFRVFNLVLLQIGNKFKFKDRKKETIINLAIKFAGLCFAILLYVFALEIFKELFYINTDANFLTAIVLILQILNIVSTTVSMTKGFYESKDNMILLSLPTKGDEVFSSKVVVYYLKDLVATLYSTITLLIAFGLVSKASFYYYFATLLTTFFLPLITTLICSLLTIPLMFVIKLLKKVPWVSVILGTAALVLVAFGIKEIDNIVQTKFGSTIRLKGVYNALIMGVNKIIIYLANNSLYIKWLRTILFIDQSYFVQFGIHFLYMFLLILITLLLNIFLSKPLFFKLSSASLEQASTKEHKKIKEKEVSTFKAFFNKELIIASRNISGLLSDYALIIVLPFYLYFLNIFFNRLSLTGLGSVATTSIFILISLMIITSSNSSSAVALSKEGAEFVLLKTSPAETSKICWAKLVINFIVTNVFILISIVLLGILNVFDINQLIYLFIVFVLGNLAHILKSMEIDLNHPMMHDFENSSNKNNTNESKSITQGIIIALIPAVLNLIYKYFIKVGTNYIFNGGLIVISVMIILVLIRLYLFYTTLKTRFDRIDY